jgi:hypothetical protein
MNSSLLYEYLDKRLELLVTLHVLVQCQISDKSRTCHRVFIKLRYGSKYLLRNFAISKHCSKKV